MRLLIKLNTNSISYPLCLCLFYSTVLYTDWKMTAMNIKFIRKLEKR